MEGVPLCTEGRAPSCKKGAPFLRRALPFVRRGALPHVRRALPFVRNVAPPLVRRALPSVRKALPFASGWCAAFFKEGAPLRALLGVRRVCAPL